MNNPFIKLFTILIIFGLVFCYPKKLEVDFTFKDMICSKVDVKGYCKRY